MSLVLIVFEVMDKELSLPGVWLLNLSLAAFGYVLCRRYKWSLLFTLPVALFFSFAHLGELHDPHVGPAILEEAGRSYVIQSYAAMTIAILASCAGALVRLKSRRLNFA